MRTLTFILAFLLTCLGRVDAQIEYTGEGWIAQDTQWIEVSTVVADDSTWYHLDVVTIQSNGFRTTASLAPPMKKYQVLEWITSWRADADVRTASLAGELAILTAAEAVLEALETTLTDP